MSINVTINGNSLNVRHGRMALSDLNQIKKNERDRRRRLRLEQVRQQAKEMSDKLLERTKNIAKEELKRIEDSDKFSIRQMHNERIMKVQQKYDEDMADIGHAHICATLECRDNTLTDKQVNTNNLTAERKEKKTKQIDNKPQETAEQLRQERLRQVRDLEDVRSRMVAKLHHKTVPVEKASIQEEVDEAFKQSKSGKKMLKNFHFKKSPRRVTKSCMRAIENDFKTSPSHLRLKSKTSKPVPKNNAAVSNQQFTNLDDVPSTSTKSIITETPEQNIRDTESEFYDKDFREPARIATITAVNNDKSARYDPEDYMQTTINSANSDSSSSSSDDSSYFSDSGERSKCVRSLKQANNLGESKTQLCDAFARQRKLKNTPIARVERIHTWNEPSAIDLAQNIEQQMDTSVKERPIENQAKEPYCAKIRGEDAVLREKVRQDYKTLMQNLNHLAREERKLKASQVERYPENVHTQEGRRKVLREQHKKKLDRAVKTLLNDEHIDQCSLCPVEKQITLTPRENERTDKYHCDKLCLNGHAKAYQSSLSKSKASEYSREEQILDMLKKVEKQKRLLLQEFGTDLPTDILSASMKHLLEKENSVEGQTITTQDKPIQTPSSPEIKVIDTSRIENNVTNKTENETDLSKTKVETAVQTVREDKSSIVQDKSIQVEIAQRETSESNFVDNNSKTNTKHYPIEPKIIVITPERDSSESTTSTLTNGDTEITKHDIKVSPIQKECAMKVMKQTPPQTSKKSTSVPANKTSFAVKKFSKSLSKSRNGHSKKVSCDLVDTPSKKIQIYVDERGFNIKVKPSETAKVAVDVSTQSSRLHASNAQGQSTSKSHWIRTQSKSIQIKDATDTSTSFASPPPVKARDVLEVLNNNVSILEMLDSSINENMLFLKRDISPVSTPETPSPRTMKLPSNIPRIDKLKKIFRYESTDSQISENSVCTPIKNDNSTLTDLPNYTRQSVDSELCLCKNPECKLMHTKFNDIYNYALKNCPQILQKYEDLQTMCAKRIISLNKLIEKIRSEENGIESSTKSGYDETSFIQLSPRLMVNDLQSVHKLVENIEAIHNQLTKTLVESQKIIRNTTIAEDESNQQKETEVISVMNGGTPKTSRYAAETKFENVKSKPKIIKDEKVNIQLDRFKKFPLRLNSDKMIEELSKEILEQSGGFNSNLMGTKEIVKSTGQRSVQTTTGIIDSKIQTCSVEKQKEFVQTKQFIPLLADIPKVSKTIENAAHSARNKPPVSLLSGPYRVEIESSGHELSTIIEFDTLDTINKSQNNVKTSPAVKKGAEAQAATSTTMIKPLATSSFKQSSVAPEQIAKNVDTTKETNSKPSQSDAINHEFVQIEESRPVSLLSTNLNNQYRNNDKITSTSSNSISGLSGISQIASTPSSDMLKPISSPEEMEIALKKLGLGWAIATLKKTREASALSSSSNSDVTPVNTAKRLSMKKPFDNNYGLPDFSDVSSISIRDASKSTEQALLLKGRTSTPKMQNSNSNSVRTNSSNTNVSENFQEPSNDLKIPNISLTKTKCNNMKKSENS